jgi:hypothetical protein
MSEATAPSVLLIFGVTRAGRAFRPSDWSERLCGVMSPFRPEGSHSPNAHLGYSPYVRPTLIDGERAVMVDSRLKDLDARAYEFVTGFAHDNDLVTRVVVLPPAD